MRCSFRRKSEVWISKENLVTNLMVEYEVLLQLLVNVLGVLPFHLLIQFLTLKTKFYTLSQLLLLIILLLV